MNIAEIREKILTFLLPVLIVGGVLGGIVALVGRTYFWDVSQLTIQIPNTTPEKVEIIVQARILYFDADLFWFYYPVHITLPRTYAQECAAQCVFDNLPPGDAVIAFENEGNPVRARILIAPDTIGELDFRPSFQIVPVTDDTITDRFMPLADDERQLLMGTIKESNRTSGLTLLFYQKQYYIYDTLLKQSIILPTETEPTHVARAELEWTYLIWNEQWSLLWDRYGRTPLEGITELVYGEYIFTWSNNETTLTSPEGEETIAGIWSPLYWEKWMITDGREVREIR